MEGKFSFVTTHPSLTLRHAGSHAECQLSVIVEVQINPSLPPITLFLQHNLVITAVYLEMEVEELQSAHAHWPARSQHDPIDHLAVPIASLPGTEKEGR